MAFCGMECIDVTDDVMKILGIYFSYNQKIEQEKNLKYLKIMEKK